MTCNQWLPHGHTGNPQQSWDLNAEIQPPHFLFKLPGDAVSITRMQVNKEKNIKWGK